MLYWNCRTLKIRRKDELKVWGIWINYKLPHIYNVNTFVMYHDT